MSLLNRLWLCVVSAMLLALVGALALSIVNARDYLAQQLYAQGSDGAAGLALSISQHRADPVTAELLLSALFDSSHFASIRYVDGNRVLVERDNPAAAPGAPGWFVTLFPLDAKTGRAEVSDGWKLAGVVEATAASRFAHASLWSSSVRLAGLMLALAIVLLVLMTLLVRWVNRSLTPMVDQAAAIGDGRFLTAAEAEVPELRVVSRALNTMVARVAAMFSEQADRIEKLRDSANRDEVTGLPSRGYFMGRLREVLDEEAAAAIGAVLMARVNDLAGLNRRRGRLHADECVRKLADALRALAQQEPDALAARLNGSDFALIVPGCDASHAQELADGLATTCVGFKAADLSDAEPAVYVGGTCYKRGQGGGDLMARADAMLAQSEAGRPAVAPAEGGAEARAAVNTPQRWRAMLDRAISERSFTALSYPVVAPDATLLHRELMLRLMSEGIAYTAAQFVPMAVRLERAADVDLGAVGLALDEIAARGDPMAVNLCGASLRATGFIERLASALEGRREAARRLCLEVGERGLSDSMAEIARLVAAVAPFGSQLGIDQFGRHFSAIPRLYEVKIAYVKIDGSFIADIDASQGNQRFVEALVQVARSLGIAVYAERVSTDAEWDALVRLGVAGMTGPAATSRFTR